MTTKEIQERASIYTLNTEKLIACLVCLMHEGHETGEEINRFDPFLQFEDAVDYSLMIFGYLFKEGFEDWELKYVKERITDWGLKRLQYI